MMSIYDEIREEEELGNTKWGGPEHDDSHTAQEWVGLICKHLGRTLIGDLAQMLSRHQLIRVAALAVAAIRWIDRRNAYDKSTSKDG